MNYFLSIKASFIIFPLIAFLFSIPFILHQYHKYGAINPYRVLIIFSFILYLITIYFLVILPLPNKDNVTYKPNMIKLIPFSFITDFLNETSFVLTNPSTYLKALTEPCFYTVFFNILMTIPFGMYLRYYFQVSLKKTIVITFLLSLFFELTQISGLYYIYKYPYRIFDVDDLMMNTLGGMIGYLLIGLVIKYLPTRTQIDEQTFLASKVVSGFRRITIFNLDFLLYSIITIFLSLFMKNKYLYLIIFTIYYIIYPYFKNGQTLGSKFLNVRLEFTKPRLIKITFRIIFLFFYYFNLVYLNFYIVNLVIDYFNLDTLRKLILIILSFSCLLIFYIINIVILLKKKCIYYDKLFGVKYISTIINDKNSTNGGC